jgi:hypothetical protein
MQESPDTTVTQPPDDHAPRRPLEVPELLDAMEPDERAELAPADSEAAEQEQARAAHRSILSALLVPTASNDDGEPERDGEPVDFKRVVNYDDGSDSYYVFTIVHTRTGAEVETRRIDADDLLSLSNLQDAVWQAGRGLIGTPRRNTRKWRRVMKAIAAAAEILEPPEPSASDWAGRLEQYLSERLTRDRDEAALRREPFEEDGQVHVHRESFQTFVNRQLGLSVTKRQTQDGLRDLGGQVVTVNYRDGERRKQRDYWRLPPGLTEALSR